MTYIFKLFLNNLMAFYVLWGMLNMLGYKSYEGGMAKVTTVMCFLYAFSIRFRPIDVLLLIYIAYCLFSYGWGDVSLEIYADGIVTQLMPISMYFLMRMPQFKNSTFLDDMKWPLLFSFISALFLYFINPSWYMAFKTQGWSYEYSGIMFYERTRLSGFWPWPYFIGYMALFYLMWEIKKLIDNKYRKDNISLIISISSIFIALLVLFFAQMRVTIAYFVIYCVLVYVYSSKVNKKKSRTFIKVLIIVIVAIFVLGLITLNYVDSDLIDYILGRSINSESNIVTDRFGIFQDYLSTISMFGEGLGSFSHFARFFGKHYVSDCEYIRIPNEIGVFGFTLLLIILLTIFHYGVRNFRFCFFEVSVMLFLFIAMIGAAPFEHLPLHPYFYWFCMGRIVTKYYKSNISKSGFVKI